MNDFKETSICAPSDSSVPAFLIKKPSKVVVPLAVGLAWGNDQGEYRYEEKVDGRFETRRVHSGETLLAGECVRGEFHAFDLLKLHGEDCRPWPLFERLEWLGQVFEHQPLDCTGGIIRRVQSATGGGELLREVLARGGEGVVRKRLDSPWGTVMEAVKRRQDFYCIVTGFNAGQSVQIALDPAHHTSPVAHRSLTDCGSVSLFGGKCDRVRVGSILKVTGFGLTGAGKIREPRPDTDSHDSWLVKY